MITDVLMYGYDPNRKISAIKFVRSVTKARDGSPLALVDAKRAVDDIGVTAPHVVIADVPERLLGLIESAASGCGVSLTPQGHGAMYPRVV